MNLHQQPFSNRFETFLIVVALAAFVFILGELFGSVLERIALVKAMAFQGGSGS